MNPMELMAIGFPAVIVIIVMISFYKVFVKKRSVTPFYTPFDQITGQTGVEFHEEQEILAEDEDRGDDKDKKTKPGNENKN
ncbi:DUF3951 domain-containing protein [Cytobacillus dafuensis]|uniref:DUF3951 domain-containing protein n=1 Tax=Cytobacillus dafuensis TaxID=1742359 RepID=A0A5B8Z001_CYTDA|nr:DUF3951 domain-containing protein [Cytobacillus dafuensis]QED46270.1 DUF3951 domain-containing protein [Cytobacillus dafuensis]